MTQVRQTSLEVYYDIITEGMLGDMQKAVFEVFKDYGNMTNKQIADRLELPINCVTPRTNELVKFNLVEVKERVKQNNGRSAIVWGLVE
jgi:predicted ArsR family transcriptional regulator